MKILIVGRCDGWMGIHMGHFSEGFRNLGHEVRLIDYHECGKVRFPRLLLGESRAAHQRRSTEHLKGLILQFKPLLIILVMAHLDFDFSEIRRFFSGSVVFYDMDGPALPCYAEGLQWIREIDLLASVSQLTVHELKARGINNTHYLPHAVDTHYYAPLPLSRVEKKRFGAPLSFVGRPTDRRERLLQSVASEGLVIWGRRWSKRKYVKNPKLAQCFREKKNVVGMDLVRLYNATTVMTNILREPFVESQTVMSLQVFAVLASSVCLLTEWVQEIEDAFEPDSEILTFRDPHEFREKAIRYSREPAAARRIGEAGRKRCLAEHTHTHRAQNLLRRVLDC